MAALQHQRGMMLLQKREQWGEDDLDGLPAGEHDYFERKSGQGFLQDRGAFLNSVAKAASAFLNSGGGSLILEGTRRWDSRWPTHHRLWTDLNA
jgi:hypothetical protein